MQQVADQGGRVLIGQALDDELVHVHEADIAQVFVVVVVGVAQNAVLDSGEGGHLGWQAGRGADGLAELPKQVQDPGGGLGHKRALI